MLIPVLSPQVDVTIEEVVRDFEIWRQTKIHARSRIPEKLWQAAVDLTKNYPISRVSRLLKINHVALRRRMSASSGTSSDLTPAEPSFVEVKLPENPPASNVPPPSLNCLIEVENSRGAHFRCTFSVTVPDNVLSLCKSLFEESSCSR